jgi:hypothetical protein
MGRGPSDQQLDILRILKENQGWMTTKEVTCALHPDVAEYCKVFKGLSPNQRLSLGMAHIGDQDWPPGRPYERVRYSVNRSLNRLALRGDIAKRKTHPVYWKHVDLLDGIDLKLLSWAPYGSSVVRKTDPLIVLTP